MFDECEVSGIGIEGLEKIGVFGAFVGLGNEGEEKGNLELNLGDIDAIKKTVEFGVAEIGFEFGIGGGFFGEEVLGVITGFLTDFGVIGVKAGRSTGEGARERIGDGAQIGRFEVAIVILED